MTGRTTESQKELHLVSTGTENIAAEECRESRAMHVNNIRAEGHMSGNVSNRSGMKSQNCNDRQPIRVSKIRGASIDAGKRSSSVRSTEHSTPEKGEDFELTLYSEIHRNLVAADAIKPSPLAKHKISKEYRTKMVDWMVEVTTSFKCTQRTYFLAVALFDEYLRAQ